MLNMFKSESVELEAIGFDTNGTHNWLKGLVVAIATVKYNK